MKHLNQPNSAIGGINENSMFQDDSVESASNLNFASRKGSSRLKINLNKQDPFDIQEFDNS